MYDKILQKNNWFKNKIHFKSVTLHHHISWLKTTKNIPK